jgi:hypothetical protein
MVTDRAEVPSHTIGCHHKLSSSAQLSRSETTIISSQNRHQTSSTECHNLAGQHDHGRQGLTVKLVVIAISLMPVHLPQCRIPQMRRAESSLQQVAPGAGLVFISDPGDMREFCGKRGQKRGETFKARRVAARCSKGMDNGSGSCA